MSEFVIDASDYLAHYGVLRKSGRYPWGSGGDKKYLAGTFLDITDGMRKQGLSDTEIAKGFNITTTELRAARSIESNARRQDKIMTAQKLADKGMSTSAIAQQMGLNESSVRSLLVPGARDRADNLQTIASVLKKNVDEKGYVQIGTGVENQLGISSTKLATAVAILREQGYEKHSIQEDQLGSPGNKTTVKVLAKPGTTYRDVVANKDKIRLIGEHSPDNGRTFIEPKPPLSIDPSRVSVNYSQKDSKGNEIGGGLADGVIYVRPGVPDVSLGGNSYAQVRIAVGGTHYLKGMAVYKDDLPDGVDLQFNTNKGPKANKLDAMKPMQIDPATGKLDQKNPFGSTIRRQILDDKNEKPTSAMNIVNEEGAWENWSNSISTQVLSKQPPSLAAQQLKKTYDDTKADLDELKALTNPTVRRHLLEKFADSADSSAVHLQAAALPRQGTHVILPAKSLKVTEVYAPNFKDGETVALIRYPHGGKFEIPELQVNNNNREAKKMLGRTARDAIAIHPKVAEKLSGADFDGDTVVVIPQGSKRPIRTEPSLKALEGFDPQRQYKPYDGMKTISGGVWNEKLQKEVFPEGKRPSSRAKNMQMGIVSNLITDMTIKGASNEKLARAVKHSMVVIDAEKHRLDWKKSAQDHGIAALHKEYQGRAQGSASTLISRATSPARLDERRPRSAKDGGPIDPKTGQLVFVPKTFTNRHGEQVAKKATYDKLAVTNDAHTLVSKERTKIEVVYADHSNRLKALANEARKEVVAFKPPRINPSAKVAYKSEVASLKMKLDRARANKPLERQAQIFANATVAQKVAANPLMDPNDLKKIKTNALNTARARVGAQKEKIKPTPQEWAAIQAGAISQNQLKQILDNADLDEIRKLATPRTAVLMTSTKTARAKQMASLGYTQAEIAEQLGVSLTTLKSVINE